MYNGQVFKPDGPLRDAKRANRKLSRNKLFVAGFARCLWQQFITTALDRIQII